MRMLVLVPAAAVLVFGTPASATAIPSLSDQAAVAVDSVGVGVRLAQANPNHPNNPNPNPNANPNGTGGDNTNNSQGCERRSIVASPSHPNNGFGNCGGDGVPGNSGKQDNTR